MALFTSALQRYRRADMHHIDAHPVRGIFAEGVHTAEELGAGYVLGQIHGRYREKAEIRGVPITAAVGFGAKAAALLGSWLGFGGMSHLNAIGSAGLTTWLFSKGVSHGTEAAGRKVYVLDKGAAVPAGLPAPTTVLDDLPPAAPGSFLNRAQLLHLARQR